MSNGGSSRSQHEHAGFRNEHARKVVAVRTMYLVYWALIAGGLLLWIGVGLVVD